MRAALLAIALLTAGLAGCIGSTDDTVEPTSTDEAVGFSNTSVYPGDYVTDDTYAHVLEQGPYERLPDEVTDIPSVVDDETIRVGVIRPDVPEGEEVPVIAVLSDFEDEEGEDVPLEEGSLDEAHARLVSADFLVDNFVSHGYAVALVAWRGASSSGGCSGLMGPNHAADLDNAVTWLGEQDWSNGKVGTLGGSGAGASQWMVAGHGNPHLETVVPIASIVDRFSRTYQNGTGWPRMGTVYAASYAPYDPRVSLNRMEEVAMCENDRAWETAMAWAYATGERGPGDVWEAWDQRDPVLENYDGSVLLVTGFADVPFIPDSLYQWIGEFEKAGGTVKHLLGQWGHVRPDDPDDDPAYPDFIRNPTPRWDYAQILHHWFDRWLKDETSVDLGPPVQVADTQNEWRNEEAWPPKDAEPDTLFLDGEGALVREGASETELLLPPEPSSWLLVAPCETCLAFETGPLEEELRFAGLPRLHISVTPSGPNGVLGSKLQVLNDGETDTVATAMMDLRFASGGEQAEPVLPGEEIVARMQFSPVDVVVPADGVLRLVVGQATPHEADGIGGVDFPPESHPPASPVLLHTGEDSTLELLTFERGEGAFFEPPGVEG